MAGNICRTCLMRYDSNDPTKFKNIQDLILHEMLPIKLIDMLIFLDCIEIDSEETSPQCMCMPCVSAVIQAFGFKRQSIEVNNLLTRFVKSRPVNHQIINGLGIRNRNQEYNVPLYIYLPPFDCTLL